MARSRYQNCWGNVADLTNIQDLSLKFQVNPLFSDNDNDHHTIRHIRSATMLILWVFAIHAVTSWIFYVFSKFSCKIQIQTFSFAFPVNLTVPITVTFLLAMCGMRTANVCAFNGILPDYVFVNVPPFYRLFDFVFKEYAWVWLLWLLSQAWVTLHIWNPSDDRNSSTEKLFLVPMYTSLLIDQCVALNRKRESQGLVMNLNGVNIYCFNLSQL